LNHPFPALQVAAPVAFANLPASQASQADAPADDARPTAHGAHSEFASPAL
jgi:hypothetical protein